MTAPQLPAWIEPAPKGPKARHAMTVSVTHDVGERFVYEAIFGSTFDAYDDAMTRFPMATRVEVNAKPAAAPKGASHGA